MRIGMGIGGLLALALALAGCGGGGSSSSSAGSSPAALTSGSTSVASTTSLANGSAVATVEDTPIAKATFTHWLAVTAALSGEHGKSASPSNTALKDKVMGFLISAEWLLGEAAARGVNVSEAAVHKRLEEDQKKQFKTPAELQSFLTTSKETTADLQLRVKLELLESAISEQVTAGKTTAAEKQAALSSFQTTFQAKWKAKTSCHPGYVTAYCKQDKNPLIVSTSTSTSTTATHDASSATSSSKSSVARSSSAGGRASAATSETYSAPGALALSSSAFERNGAIPAQYTCDGANISPPLQWENIPKGTAELVLFVIDDSSEGKTGGIRWVVGGIEPSVSEVKAGATPPGAVVGRNGAGTADYGGICPAKGKTANIEFVLYALKQKIALTTGFTPAKAESEYGGHEIGSATYYATYTRA